MSNQKSYQLGNVHTVLVHERSGAVSIQAARELVRDTFPAVVIVSDGHYDDKTHSWKFFVA